MSKNGRQPKVPGINIVELFRMMPEFRRDAIEAFANIARRHGDVVRFSGLWTSFLLTEASHIEHVLVSNSRNYHKGRVYKELTPSTGEGLFVTDGEVWLRQRRMAQPAFHRDRIAAFAEIMVGSTEEMLDRWKVYADASSVLDVGDEMTRVTLGIVGRALLSHDISDNAAMVNKSFGVIREHTMRRLTSFIKLPQSLPTPANSRFRAAIAEADEMVYSIINERRASGEKPDDLLSMLTEARDEDTGEAMTDKELRDQALTIIGAGYETTTQALTWLWYLLARHPAAEEKLHTEIDTVLEGRRPTFADVPRLKYTLMAFSEAMRLYPPAWMLSRTALNDDAIGGYRIPARSEVLLLLYFTHRHPKYWPDEEKFDPENFAPERIATRPKFAYLPFGGGPRQCIGNNFALMEAQLIIATVAQRYRLVLETDQEVRPEPSVTLRPKGGLKMRLVPR